MKLLKCSPFTLNIESYVSFSICSSISSILDFFFAYDPELILTKITETELSVLIVGPDTNIFM